MKAIKKNKVIITLMDSSFSSGCIEMGPVWNDADQNKMIYIDMKWESKDGPQNRLMTLEIDELKNAIRLVEDSEYE